MTEQFEPQRYLLVCSNVVIPEYSDSLNTQLKLNNTWRRTNIHIANSPDAIKAEILAIQQQLKSIDPALAPGVVSIIADFDFLFSEPDDTQPRNPKAATAERIMTLARQAFIPHPAATENTNLEPPIIQYSIIDDSTHSLINLADHLANLPPPIEE